MSTTGRKPNMIAMRKEYSGDLLILSRDHRVTSAEKTPMGTHTMAVIKKYGMTHVPILGLNVSLTMPAIKKAENGIATEVTMALQ